MKKLICQFLILSSVILKTVNCLGEDGNFTALFEIVESSLNEAAAYVAPEDNSNLVEVNEPEVRDYGTFDFIVIGTGAGGSVIGSRLSEIATLRVLILEAGDYQHNPVYKILGLYDNFKEWNSSWGYSTTEQKNGCLAQKTRACKFSQGKVFGGSTGINGNAYTRGHPEDFNRWANLTGDENWSYESVLPYFKKSEKVLYNATDDSYHGHDGPLTTNITEKIDGLTNVVFESLNELGLKTVDLAGPIAVGVDKVTTLRTGNERLSASRAFLEPFFSRSNLDISLNSFVTRILFDGDVAIGVEFVKNGTKFMATAGKEVIVSAGAINSPQILMLSGIGPIDELKRLNISVVKNLPVGEHFQDHPYYTGILFRQRAVNFTNNLEDLLKLYVKGMGPLVAGGDTIALSRLGNEKKGRPEIEYIFNVPAPSQESGTVGMTPDYVAAYTSNNQTDIWFPTILLHPQSQGTITLKSSSPVDKPLIDPQYYANEIDLENMYKGVQEFLKIQNTTAFQRAGGELIILDSPGCEEEKYSKEWWFCSFKHWTDSPYHPTGTNKMGISPEDSVVDPQLRVHGVKNLRVVDASVIPGTVSGHTMAATYMVAERAADLIKFQYEKK